MPNLRRVNLWKQIAPLKLKEDWGGGGGGGGSGESSQYLSTFEKKKGIPSCWTPSSEQDNGNSKKSHTKNLPGTLERRALLRGNAGRRKKKKTKKKKKGRARLAGYLK